MEIFPLCKLRVANGKILEIYDLLKIHRNIRISMKGNFAAHTVSVIDCCYQFTPFMCACRWIQLRSFWGENIAHLLVKAEHLIGRFMEAIETFAFFSLSVSHSGCLYLSLVWSSKKKCEELQPAQISEQKCATWFCCCFSLLLHCSHRLFCAHCLHAALFPLVFRLIISRNISY